MLSPILRIHEDMKKNNKKNRMNIELNDFINNNTIKRKALFTKHKN